MGPKMVHLGGSGAILAVLMPRFKTMWPLGPWRNIRDSGILGFRVEGAHLGFRGWGLGLGCRVRV